MNKNKETLTEVLSSDFQYHINYDYDRNNDNCQCEDYCRCSTIENARINSIDMIAITKKINNVFDGDEFTEYIINRILTACKLYNTNYWNFRICGGYYGEEVGGIYIDNPDVGDWLYRLEKIQTNEGRLFIALECEYGYILDELKAKKWSIETIDKDKLIIGQKEHYQKLDRNIVSMYEDYPYATGVCIDNGKCFKLIDGYHRVTANNESEIKMIVGR